MLFPVLLLLVFGLVQGALWYHARDVASAAAQEGVRAGRADGSTLDVGRQRALDFLRDAGSADVLADPAVQATGDPARITLVVTGHSLSLLPGVAGLRVEQSASGPLERFTSRATA